MYDVEEVDGPASETVPAFAAAFADLKKAGLAVGVTVSHSAPYATDTPADAVALAKAFASDKNVDIISPQLYSSGTETAPQFDETASCAKEVSEPALCMHNNTVQWTILLLVGDTCCCFVVMRACMHACVYTCPPMATLGVYVGYLLCYQRYVRAVNRRGQPLRAHHRVFPSELQHQRDRVLHLETGEADRGRTRRGCDAHAGRQLGDSGCHQRRRGSGRQGRRLERDGYSFCPRGWCCRIIRHGQTGWLGGSSADGCIPATANKAVQLKNSLQTSSMYVCVLTYMWMYVY